jgi:hypothetical protein
VNCGGPGFFGRQEFVERGVDGFGARGEELLQVESSCLKRNFLIALKRAAVSICGYS